MIKQHFVRAFERGARRGHRTNTGLKTDACEVIFDTEDSMNVYQMGAFSPQLRIFIYYAELQYIPILVMIWLRGRIDPLTRKIATRKKDTLACQN